MTTPPLTAQPYLPLRPAFGRPARTRQVNDDHAGLAGAGRATETAARSSVA
ncbi:hypothetical protein ACIHFE_13230 [Streptomyces sp. NPDC052396]|uniref:hypothetical protein n=1 Tax=Streptomyces sp. NPDC052396 TaxID=3365689 RepID=UPI0037D619E2